MKYLQSLVNRNVFQSVRKLSLTVSAWLCTIGSLVADVLQPIAPFAFYLFLISLSLLVVLSIIYAIGKKEILGALILAGISCAATGVFTLMQQGKTSEEIGILAATVPGIEALQSQLGIIDKKLDDLKEDTETIKASTARIESQSEAVLQSIEAIQEGINNDAGIIGSPRSPEDYYHNARIHELSGDYAAARRAYLEYFKSDLPQIDPHLRFISFLKVQEGTAGARETYNELTARSSSPVPAYTRLLLLNPDRRKEELKSYFDQNPEFAPAAYHMSLEFSESRLGSQTLSDKREELFYLKAFQEADENGGLLRYLIDQELATEWRTDAQERRTAIENGFSSTVLENPVSISWMAHNAGWNGNIQISEPALDILWNVKGQSGPTSTGDSGYNNPSTGKPAPRAFFSLPKSQPDSTIEIRYLDSNSVERGPYEFQFTAQKESDDGNRRILEMTSTSWVLLRDYEGSTLLYFTQLLTYRGALEKIEYGINTDTPDQSFPFPSWNKPGLADIDGSFPIYQTVPNETEYVTVQLTYKNGEKSPITKFYRN
jgi:hypothetical protein